MNVFETVRNLSHQVIVKETAFNKSCQICFVSFMITCEKYERGRIYLISKVNSIYLHGMEGMRVVVEADVSTGIPGYSMVGYLASEVKEAQDRVRTAIKNLNISLQPKKITINLSPADTRKEGTGFDLAIAVAVLGAYGMFPLKEIEGSLFLGELGLDGRIKGVSGALALMAWAKENGFRHIFLPKENLKEVSVLSMDGLIGVGSLEEVLQILRQGKFEKLTCQETEDETLRLNHYPVDFSEINGQRVLRRAAEVAAAGKHNMLMIGPAGSGKTMMAKRIPTILPPLNLDEAIEISKIYSVSNLLNEKMPIITARPFRAPHHTISANALVGGGTRPKPGEISLATGGILFLDELPEMGRTAIEALRQPLEDKKAAISRVHGTVVYPAEFQLIAAMNPCKCGHYPDMEKCTCSLGEIRHYLMKVSRPLLDRIDICVEATAMTYAELRGKQDNEASETVRERVIRAREIQRERFSNLGIHCNSEMSGSMVRKFCTINNEESRFMEEIFTELQFSARMHDKILKVARTTADLAGRTEIAHADLCEAISYVRVRDKYWKNQR